MRCRTSSSPTPILPRFKAGDFAGGIERGVDDIIAALTDRRQRSGRRRRKSGADPSRTATPRPLLVFCRGSLRSSSSDDAPPRGSRALGLPRRPGSSSRWARAGAAVRPGAAAPGAAAVASAGFPAAAARRAAAALRELVMAISRPKIATHLPRRSARRSEHVGRDRLRAGAARPPTIPSLPVLVGASCALVSALAAGCLHGT